LSAERGKKEADIARGTSWEELHETANEGSRIEGKEQRLDAHDRAASPLTSWPCQEGGKSSERARAERNRPPKKSGKGGKCNKENHISALGSAVQVREQGNTTIPAKLDREGEGAKLASEYLPPKKKKPKKNQKKRAELELSPAVVLRLGEREGGGRQRQHRV